MSFSDTPIFLYLSSLLYVIKSLQSVKNACGRIRINGLAYVTTNTCHSYKGKAPGSGGIIGQCHYRVGLEGAVALVAIVLFDIWPGCIDPPLFLFYQLGYYPLRPPLSSNTCSRSGLCSYNLGLSIPYLPIPVVWASSCMDFTKATADSP